jgi:hypothetical protein
MRWIPQLLAMLLAFAVPAAALSAQDADIVVRGDFARSEIERILKADNVDTSVVSRRRRR